MIPPVSLIRKEGRGWARVSLVTSSRTTILRFTSHETNIYVFMLIRNGGRTKYSNALRWSYFVKQSASRELTRVLRTLLAQLAHYALLHVLRYCPYKCKSIVIIFHRMLTFTFNVIFFLLGVGRNFLLWFSVVRKKLLLPQKQELCRIHETWRQWFP